MSPYYSSPTHTGRILTRTRVDDRIDYDLDRILICEQVDDIKCVLDDAARHELLTSVASFAHDVTGEAFDDRAGGFAESFHLVATGGVGEEDGVLIFACDVALSSGERDGRVGGQGVSLGSVKQ